MTLTDLLPILLAAYEEHGDLPIATGFDDHRQILGVLISPIEKDCEVGKRGEMFLDFY